MTKCNSIEEAVMAMEEAMRDDSAELLEHLQQLARSHGRVEIVRNADGSFDVRAGGVSCYASGLRNALRARVQNEVDRVTVKMSGETPGLVGGGKLAMVGIAQANKVAMEQLNNQTFQRQLDAAAAKLKQEFELKKLLP